MFRKPRVLRLYVHPDPLLTQKSAEVVFADEPKLNELIADMGRTMYEGEGCGLAAIQVGIPKRIVVYDVSENMDELSCIINPVIIKHSDACETADEGCLSFPGLWEPIERSTSIVVEGFSAKGEPIHLELEGFPARVLQHEIDHTEGKTMLDRMDGELKRAALREYFNFPGADTATSNAVEE